MKPKMISFHCTLKNSEGKTIRTSLNREGLINPGLAEATLSGLSLGLKDLKKGERRSIALSADQAYGLHDSAKIALFPRVKLQNNRTLTCGEQVSIVSKTGVKRNYRLLEMHGEMMMLDGNHPLAGQDLIFEIEATSVRDATDVEALDSSLMISSQSLHS